MKIKSWLINLTILSLIFVSGCMETSDRAIRRIQQAVKTSLWLPFLETMFFTRSLQSMLCFKEFTMESFHLGNLKLMEISE